MAHSLKPSSKRSYTNIKMSLCVLYRAYAVWQTTWQEVKSYTSLSYSLSDELKYDHRRLRRGQSVGMLGPALRTPVRERRHQVPRGARAGCQKLFKSERKGVRIPPTRARRAGKYAHSGDAEIFTFTAARHVARWQVFKSTHECDL